MKGKDMQQKEMMKLAQIAKRTAALLLSGCLLGTAFSPLPGDTLAADRQKEVEVLFTHDMHSYLESRDADGRFVQNIARIAYLKNQEQQNGKTAFLLDGGDFSMGTLYQNLFEDYAAELSIMGMAGYDATTLGNHEFDYGSDGLADMLESAVRNKEENDIVLPQMVCSNIDWEQSTSDENQRLHDALDHYGTQSYAILEQGEVRIGVFGIMGNDSISCAPLSHLTFEDQTEAAKETVKELQKEDVDMIVCLSHSGTWSEIEKSEDEQLAKNVPEIDLIVSGHTHSELDEPIVYDDTVIMSANAYAENVGKVELQQKEDGRWAIEDYEIVKVSDIPGQDARVSDQLAKYHELINKECLEPIGYEWNQILVNNDMKFSTIDEIWSIHGEDAEGEFIADAYREAIKNAEGENYVPIDWAIIPSGIIRTTIPMGEVSTWDAFSVSSLGIGDDGLAGYPIIAMYLSGKELKTVAEIDASLSQFMTGVELFPSGGGWKYNPHRMLLNKVTDVWTEDENGEKQPIDDDKLYRVAVDQYTCNMLGSVKKVSRGLLSLEPKNAEGIVTDDYEKYAVRDENGEELKAWVALARYLERYGDEGKSIKEEYGTPLNRKVINDSKKFTELVKQPNRFFFGIMGIGLAVVLIVSGIIYGIIRLIKKRNRGSGKKSEKRRY